MYASIDIQVPISYIIFNIIYTNVIFLRYLPLYVCTCEHTHTHTHTQFVYLPMGIPISIPMYMYYIYVYYSTYISEYVFSLVDLTTTIQTTTTTTTTTIVIVMRSLARCA